MFSLHIANHMLIAMLAPVLFGLRDPLPLAHQALAAAPGRLAGPREWLRTLAESRVTVAATHPLVVAVVFAGAQFALYFTGLFDAAVRFHWAHLAIDVVFLIIGYLFAWTAIGVDPTPRPLPGLGRLGLLLAVMPTDIDFGALLIGSHTVIGNGPARANMYSAVALPWVHGITGLLADQRACTATSNCGRSRNGARRPGRLRPFVRCRLAGGYLLSCRRHQ